VEAATDEAARDRSREATTAWRERALAAIAALTGVGVGSAAALDIAAGAAAGALATATGGLVVALLAGRQAQRALAEHTDTADLLKRMGIGVGSSVTAEPSAGLRQLGSRLAEERAALQELGARSADEPAHG
jgi:hypothetical protein